MVHPITKTRFDRWTEEGLAFTFGELWFRPHATAIEPKDVDLRTRITSKLYQPGLFLTAPMDTVTETVMGIEAAINGSMGIIHNNMSIEEQAKMVKAVKHHQHGFNTSPICYTPDQTLGDILNDFRREEYHFDSFPIVIPEGDRKQLVGMIKGGTLIRQKPDELISKFMTNTAMLRVAQDIGYEDALKMMTEHDTGKLFVVDEGGYLKGMYTFKDVARIVENKQISMNVDSQNRLVVGAAIGNIKKNKDKFNSEYERAEALVTAGADVLVIDSSHGGNISVAKTCRYLKEAFGEELQVIAGNITYPDDAEALIEAGADAIKVGQGSGGICSTGPVTGATYPQLSAVYEVAQKVGKRVPIISDGGIVYSADIAIALALGASAVMVGGFVAATDEACGKEVLVNGERFKEYRGMGSISAMEAGDATRYNQTDRKGQFSTYAERRTIVRGGESDGSIVTAGSKHTSEGIETMIKYKGPVKPIFEQAEWGVRAGMSATDAQDISTLWEKAIVYRTTATGTAKIHPTHSQHKPQPNYST